MVNSFFNWLEWQLLPGQCILCGATSQQRADICPACQQDLPQLGHHCQRCALPLATTATECGQCLQRPPPYQYSSAGWSYQYPIAQLISSFKYQRKFSHGRVLADLLAQQLQQRYQHHPLPDAIIATPLHWSRQLRRGFNQSELIAQRLAKQLNLPLSHCLQRKRRTPPQQQLNAKQRQRNLLAAFHIKGEVTGQRLAVVDDVVTTGATAREISRCLIAAGAKEVHVWCLARTPK